MNKTQLLEDKNQTQAVYDAFAKGKKMQNNFCFTNSSFVLDTYSNIFLKTTIPQQRNPKTSAKSDAPS